MLPYSVAEKCINYLVFSRIDYCNALLIGVSKSSLNKLQYLQNSAARILNGARVGDHITPVLETLHWLPVKYRVDFLILVLTYKALHGLTPQYLADLLMPYMPSRNLRSSQHGLLVVPKTRLRSCGDRAFSTYAPKLWNSLPAVIRDANSLAVFKTSLKTCFFLGMLLFD